MKVPARQGRGGTERGRGGKNNPNLWMKSTYTQYELYGTGYMGHFFGLVENSEKIRDVTSL